MFVPYVETWEKSEANWTLQIALKHRMHVFHCNLEGKIEKTLHAKTFRVQCHRCTYTKKD
jgi:hypothetical protein